MDTKNEKCYDIVAGPNRDALFDACKYASNKNVSFVVKFSIAVGYTAPKDDSGCAYIPMDIKDIKILGIDHEDGSGHSFNLHGYCMADPESFGRPNKSYKQYKFKAYYNAKKREGRITLL